MEVRPSPRPISLAALAGQVAGARLIDDPDDVEVSGVAVDSRRVRPADLFAAVQGEHAHGADFIETAKAAGAVAVLTDEAGLVQAQRAQLPVLVVDDPRAHIGDVAAEVYRHPSTKLLTFAVTGTNGKTTTTWLLEAGLRAAGHVTGLIGTVQTLIAEQPLPSVRTTPEAAELQAILAVMVEEGVTAVAVEVSSHALQLGRVDGVQFDVAGFTQFGSDHLDFHASLDEYFSAKARLFTPGQARRAVVCVDDDGGRRIARESTIPIETLATIGPAVGRGDIDRGDTDRGDIDWSVTETTPRKTGGYEFVLHGPDSFDLPMSIQLPGTFNIANAALAEAMLHVAGVDGGSARGIESCEGVPGRMQSVSAGQDFIALVDYAHTPDALTTVLASLRDGTSGRLILVVGAGGDRDAHKRPLMGAAAARGADLVIVTDDNPRSEKPAAIRAAVMAGALAVPELERADVLEVAGREAAIGKAVDSARLGDVVVVAGKGHEIGQEFGDHVERFDDREVLLDRLRDWTSKEGR
jgi:UDP-N-acetylmuramoyl-L-alanyl-D-glutamate--2,6-diaminopimelate ligase